LVVESAAHDIKLTIAVRNNVFQDDVKLASKSANRGEAYALAVFALQEHLTRPRARELVNATPNRVNYIDGCAGRVTHADNFALTTA
jgi:hypothetical protein